MILVKDGSVVGQGCTRVECLAEHFKVDIKRTHTIRVLVNGETLTHSYDNAYTDEEVYADVIRDIADKLHETSFKLYKEVA